MRSLLIPILIASGVMITGCASRAFTAPVATIQPAPPLECRIPCLNPPSMSLPREQWEAAVWAWGADCKALHDDCVRAISQ